MRSAGKSGAVLAKSTRAAGLRTISANEGLPGGALGGGGRLADRGGRGGGGPRAVGAAAGRGAVGAGPALSADPWAVAVVTGAGGRHSLMTERREGAPTA